MTNYHNSTIKIKSSRLKRGGPISRKCKVCRKTFQTWPYRIREGVQACSAKCAGVLRRNRSVHNCAFCGNEFTRAVSQVFYRGAKYCSKECANKGTIADHAIRPIRDKYGRSRRRGDLEWQKAVRDKDDYTCQRCGTAEQYIHTHHVAPRSQRPDLKHDVSNGKCLCNSCHAWVHEHPIEARAMGLLSGETYELARKKVRGVDHGMSKLSAEQVRDIRVRKERGENADTLAAEFHLSRSAVFRLIAGRTYEDVA